MARKQTNRRRGLAVAAALTACAQPGDGGLTARIEFAQTPDEGVSRRALRAAAVPNFIDRLQILALDASGATLAETNLFASPVDGQLRLFRQGGTWSLDAVPAGPNRIIAGRAYWGPSANPRLDGALVYSGELPGVTVVAGQTTDAGVLVLTPGPNRVPEADFDAPAPPVAPSATARPQGNAVEVAWRAPADADVAGYLVAYSDTASGDAPPSPTRGETHLAGAALADDYDVGEVVIGPPRAVELSGLTNGVPVTVAVYAFDADADGQPLNYGAPAIVFGTPQDSLPPGAPERLSVQLNADGDAEIRFVAPGEDGPDDPAGRPAFYELRTADERAVLEDERFGDQAGVEAPPPADPGAEVRFVRSLRALGITTDTPRYIGARAVDASANVGPTAVAELTVTSSATPRIVALQPAVAFAGRELLIRGARFGATEGIAALRATESATTTVALPVLAWDDAAVLVQIPPGALTGILVLTRDDGRAAEAPLAVVTRIDGVLPSDAPPFAFVADGPRGDVAGLYREGGFTVEASVQRVVDLSAEGTPWAPVVPGRRSDQIVSARNADRFLFASRNADRRLDVALVNSSTTISADPFRTTASIGLNPADSLGLAALPAIGPRVPAVIVLTLQGELLIGTIGDARIDPPGLFFPVSSTVAAYDAATVTVGQNGAGLIAHRSVTGTTAQLTIRRSPTSQPGSFVPVVGPGENAGPRIVARALPGENQRFVVAYEHVTAGGPSRIRLLDADDFADTAGLAPFPATDLELQDFGWVTRQGRVFIAVAAVRRGATAELHYTEVPLDALSTGAEDGGWPGAVLDVASAGAEARIGCTHDLATRCLIAWMSDAVGALFVRQ